MTIETVTLRSRPRRWLTVVGSVLAVVAGWLGVILTLTFFSPAGKAMAVIGPQARALAAVGHANGRVVSTDGYVTIARSDDANFVAQLYASGALLVLDAEQAGGCLGLINRVTAKL